MSDPERPPDTMSVPEATKALGISRQRLYQLIAMRRIDSLSGAEGRIWIPKDAVVRRVAGQRRLRSNQCVSTREVAQFFGVDPRTVREWHISGLLRAHKIDNLLCFNPNDVIKFIPPTYGSAGRYPGKKPTRTLQGRYYPAPEGQ